MKKPTPKSEEASCVPAQSTVIREKYISLRAPPKPPLHPRQQSLQTSSSLPGNEPPPATFSALDSSELLEQPKTPRLARASLALPIRSKVVGGERPFPETSRSQPRLRIPSLDSRLPSGSPLERVKQSEVPGSRPRPEDAPTRQNRYKPQSRLSRVFCAVSPGNESPRLDLTEPSSFDDNDRGRLLTAPEGHSDVERPSSSCWNRTATLRALQGLETAQELTTPSSTTETLPGEEFGRSTGLFSRTALIPKPLRPPRTVVAGPEAKGSEERGSNSSHPNTEHPNLSAFRFSFGDLKAKGPDSVDKIPLKPEPAILPSPLPHPEYSTPPSSPELEEEVQTYQFSVPTLEGASVSDFERPSRRQPRVKPASPIRHSSSHPLSSGPYQGLKERGGGLDTFDPLFGPCHSTKSSLESSAEFSESPTPRPTKAGGQCLGQPGSEQAGELTPRITRTVIQHHQRPSDSESESGSDTMDHLRPESALAVSQHRREAMRLAKAQEASVIEKCRRSGAAIPEYGFDELIGKGSFGRVYKW